MEINYRHRFFFGTLIFSPHNSQRIGANADATNSTTTTIMTTHSNTHKHTTQTHHATPHQAHSLFQHRYRPTSFQVARGLHRNTQKCFLHHANMFARQGLGHGPRTLALKASQGRVYRERTGRAISVIVIEKELLREKRKKVR